MKLSIRHRPRRRDFIQWIGGAALALPALELFEHEAMAQVATKKSTFAVFIYTNDGMYPPSFFPSGPDPTNSPTLNVLAPYKDKVLVLGPQLTAPGAYPTPDTGLTYNLDAMGRKPLQHRANICITGSAARLPVNGDQFHAVNTGDGPSVDYVIGQSLQNTDPSILYPYLLMGMHPIGGDTPSDITYDMAGNPQGRMSSVAEITDRLFPVLPTGGPAILTEQHKETAVTDFLNSSFASLKPQLSAYDQGVLAQHLASVRTFENRSARILAMQGSPQAAACRAPSAAMVPTDPASFQTGADTEFLSPFIMQAIATAFHCNMTRVATVSFGYPGGGGAGGLRMPWLGFTDAQHGASHYGANPASIMKYSQMNAWTMGQVKVLMDDLAMIPAAGGGTLLDQTTIYFFNRHGDGNGHTNFGLPNMILGGTGGYFKMGQNLTLARTSPTKVLISIANAMGINLSSFGAGAYKDTSPLAGIAA